MPHTRDTSKAPKSVECVIKGKRTPFGTSTTLPLEEAKVSYKNKYFSKHIGSGYVLYIDGVEYKFSKLMHFFVKP